MLNSDGAELRKILLDLGLHIAPGKGKNRLSTYLQVWPVDERYLAAERTGWLNDAFVLPGQIIGNNAAMIVFQTDGVTPKHFRQSGTLEQWQREVAAKCVGNSRLIIPICCAFAGAILHIMGEESGGLHFTGKSSLGKTTALHGAASVCGRPDAYLRSWRATANGLEGVASEHNDALLILDEISQVDPKEAGETAYMLANGKGKQRAKRNGAARDVHEWRLLFLSSGEVSLSTHMSEKGRVVRAGQEVRMADIPAETGSGHGLFENIHGNKNGAVFSEKFKKACSLYYGTPFIEYLTRITSRAGGMSQLKIDLNELAGEMVDLLCDDNADGQVLRVARRFCIIAAAGLLAEELGITNWGEDEIIVSLKKCFDAWVDGRGGVGDKETERIKDQVKGFLEKHGNSRFSDIKGDDERSVINRAGFYEEVDGVNEYYVLPSAFKEMLSGFERRDATEILVSVGWLKTDQEGKNSVRKLLPGMGRTRCYHFTKEVWKKWLD